VDAARRKGGVDALGDDLGTLTYQLGPDGAGDGILADPGLRQAAAGLQAGQVSPVLRSAHGLHVLVCLSNEPAGPGDLAGARSRVTAVVRARKQQAALDQWMGELRERYAVRIHR
jgi:hypothetical protein